jgi:hypothetical protein
LEARGEKLREDEKQNGDARQQFEKILEDEEG